MTFTAPSKILIESDNNIIELVKVIPKSINRREVMYLYKYIKSETKLGKEMELTEEYIKKQLTNFFKIIL